MMSTKRAGQSIIVQLLGMKIERKKRKTKPKYEIRKINENSQKLGEKPLSTCRVPKQQLEIKC